METITIFSLLIALYLFVGFLQLFAFWISWDEPIGFEIIAFTLLFWPSIWLNLPPSSINSAKKEWRKLTKIYLAGLSAIIIVFFIIKNILRNIGY